MKRLLLATLIATASFSAEAQSASGSQSSAPAQEMVHFQNASPIKLSVAKLEFGIHDIGTTSDAQSIEVKNEGNAPLVIISITTTGDFTESDSCSGSLGPDKQCVVSVKFSPTETQERDGLLSLKCQIPESKATASCATLPLTGTGFAPRLRVLPSVLNFGSQLVDSTSVVRTLTLTAGPDAVVKVSNVSSSGDFAVVPNGCQQLERAAACTVSVTFVPKQLGATTGSITITNDATSAPKSVALTGNGVARCNIAQSIFSLGGLASLGPVLIVVFLYLLGLVLVRWNMVALPTRQLLQAQVEAVRRRVEALTPAVGEAPSGIAQIKAMLTQAEQLTQGRGALNRAADYLFWTRGQELAAWGYVHEAEEQLALFLPVETVRAALERAETDLRQAATPPALASADRIHEALGIVPPTPADGCRPVLQDVLNFLAPESSTLAAEVDRALGPAANLTPAQCQQLAGKVVTVLTPQAASLAYQIEDVLGSAQVPTPAQLRTLLQQAAELLKPRAMALAETLREAGNAAPPLTIDQWKPLLIQVREYLIPQSAELATRIRETLAAVDRWRALLAEALGLLYDRTDTNFATLISWHNKTVWLVGCGLLFIVSLAAALQHGVLFLVGATGGLLSRLARSLYRADVPTDYGASWTSLFLSPVVGALAGWSGVLLIILGVQLNVLGPLFKLGMSDWCNPYTPFALGSAFLLGFSERAFDGILKQLEEKTQAQVQASQAPASELKITTPASLPDAKVNQNYSQSLTVSGGAGPYKWTLTTGNLPTGLKLDPSGQISGAATSAGTAKFTLQVSDAASKTKSLEFTIVVA